MRRRRSRISACTTPARCSWSTTASDQSLTDLGVWNVIGNPDFPKPQSPIWEIVCRQETGSTHPLLLLGACNPGAIVAKSIAAFKTPGLRDLSHSAPYLHNGQFDTLDAVVELYRTTSGLARNNQLRNGAKELLGIALTPADIAPLRAFLRALNEDYS